MTIYKCDICGKEENDINYMHEAKALKETNYTYYFYLFNQIEMYCRECQRKIEKDNIQDLFTKTFHEMNDIKKEKAKEILALIKVV